MSQEKGTDNLYKRPGYIFILSLPLIRGARHSLRIKSFYFTAANIRTISLTSKQIPRFFSSIRPFFLPNPPSSKKSARKIQRNKKIPYICPVSKALHDGHLENMLENKGVQDIILVQKIAKFHETKG